MHLLMLWAVSILLQMLQLGTLSSNQRCRHVIHSSCWSLCLNVSTIRQQLGDLLICLCIGFRAILFAEEKMNSTSPPTVYLKMAMMLLPIQHTLTAAAAHINSVLALSNMCLMPQLHATVLHHLV